MKERFKGSDDLKKKDLTKKYLENRETRRELIIPVTIRDDEIETKRDF